MNGWRTLLPNAWYVAIREFRSRVRTRSFMIGTVLLAAIAFAATQLPVVIDAAISSSQTSVAVVPQTTGLPADSQILLERQLNGTTTPQPYVITWLAPDEADSAQQSLEAKKLDVLVLIGREPASGNVPGPLTFTVKTDMAVDGRPVSSIAAASQILAVEDRLARAGSSLADIQNTKVEIVPVTASGQTNNTATQVSSNLIGTGLVVLIFMAIVTYGMWVAMSVAEEKGSRVMELMLNATTPLQMLAGKVIGNGAAGLAQYGVILGAVVGGLLAQGPIHDKLVGGQASTPPFGGLTPSVFVAFVILFLGGFLLYALLYAALGSLVSRQEDVQSATSPLMMLIFIGYFASVFALNSIDEPWVKILSFVPFFSPYLMLARVAVGHVEPWEFALAVAILAASIAVALVVAARIYSAGVLLYGQRQTLRQVLRASRVAR
jgi:ABC-2 type transport system permease protein